MSARAGCVGGWIAATAVALLAGCDAGQVMQRDAGSPDAGEHQSDLSELEKFDAFWDAVAICGTSVEQHATISLAAAAADAVVVGTFEKVALGNTVQGGAAEDFYAEANVTISITETLRGQMLSAPEVSLIIADSRREYLDAMVKTLQSHLPTERVLLLLRKRNDIAGHPNLYVGLGGDRSLWTRTSRSSIDNPIAADFCLDHYGPGVVDSFLEGKRSIEQLAAFLR